MSSFGEDDENGGEKDCYRLVALDDVKIRLYISGWRM